MCEAQGYAKSRPCPAWSEHSSEDRALMMTAVRERICDVTGRRGYGKRHRRVGMGLSSPWGHQKPPGHVMSEHRQKEAG